MEDTLKSAADLVRNPAFWMLVAWLVREIWGGVRKKNSEYQATLKENSSAIQLLTIAITKLEVKFESIERLTADVPKIKNDLNFLHSRVRDISNGRYPQTQEVPE